MTRAARRLAVRGRPEAISVVNIVSGLGDRGAPASWWLSDLVAISWRSRAISCDLACAADTEIRFRVFT